MASNAGYGFFGLVISSGIIGFATDKFFETAPWGLMGFLLIGIVYGTYKAQMAMNPAEDDPPKIDDGKKDDKKV